MGLKKKFYYIKEEKKRILYKWWKIFAILLFSKAIESKKSHIKELTKTIEKLEKKEYEESKAHEHKPIQKMAEEDLELKKATDEITNQRNRCDKVVGNNIHQ